MADGLTLNSGSGGATLATDDAGAAGHVQVVKLALSADGSAVPITADADGMLVNLGTNNDVTVTGNVTVVQATATNLKVDASGVAVPITDNAGSLTVDYATTGSGNATGALRVELANNGTGLLATVSTVTTVGTLTGGAIAHDGADSGNPLKIGARAETSPKGITLVADGDRTDLLADADGMLMVKIGTAYGDLISERVSNTDGNSTAFSTFGAAASLRNFITQITVHNAHATTNGYVDLRDGTAGSILYTLPLPATGGTVVHFNPPLRQPTANTALAFDVSAAITTVYISINGFQSKA